MAIDGVEQLHVAARLRQPGAVACGAERKGAQWMGILSYDVTTPRR
jgi:hypothetical protein